MSALDHQSPSPLAPRSLDKRTLIEFLRGKPYFLVLHLLIVALAVEVVLLATENRQLKSRSATLPLKQIERGDHLILAGLENLGTKPRSGPSPYRGFFVFTTSCAYCRQSLPAWRIITLMSQNLPISIQGISLDTKENTLRFIEDTTVVFPVATVGDAKGFRERNRIFTVPQTIIVSDSGVVRHVWHGALDQTKLDEVLRAMSELSGLTK